jgi:hypothetical protein
LLRNLAQQVGSAGAEDDIGTRLGERAGEPGA